MKLFIFVLLIIAVLSFKGKYKHLKGLDTMLNNLEKDLTNEAAGARKKIIAAKRSKVNAYKHRKKMEDYMKKYNKDRIKSEVDYNTAKKDEEDTLKKLREAEQDHRQKIKDYKKTFRDQNKILKGLHEELQVLCKLLGLVGKQNSQRSIHECIKIEQEKLHLSPKADNRKTFVFDKPSKYHKRRKRFYHGIKWKLLTTLPDETEYDERKVKLNKTSYEYDYLKIVDIGDSFTYYNYLKADWEQKGIAAYLHAIKMRGTDKYFAAKLDGTKDIFHRCGKSHFKRIDVDFFDIRKETWPCLFGREHMHHGCAKTLIVELPHRGQVEILSDLKSVNHCTKVKNTAYLWHYEIYAGRLSHGVKNKVSSHLY